MIAALVVLACQWSAALGTQPATTGPAAIPEQIVAAELEEVRKAELFLDAEALSRQLAVSFTVVENGARISGSFAYLEPLRRMRERGARVSEVAYDQIVVKVYGDSAIASYVFSRVWKEGGRRHRHRGWSSDVFELRDDGRWLLVHRQRCSSSQ